MNRLSFCLAIFFIIFSMYPVPVLADTIPDNTHVYGNWNIEGSPYVIMGLAIIPIDSTLMIEPGVQVKFKSSTNDSAFIIQYLDIGWIKAFGKMIALGTESDSIIFTSLGEGHWGGIHFENVVESNHFSYCNIGKCRSIGDELIPGETHVGGLTFKNSQALIEHTNLSYNHIGVSAWNSQIMLEQNKITNNTGGVVYFESSGKVSSSLISNNYDEGINSHTSSVFIENNLIEGQLRGIHSYESSDTIVENLIRNNLWGGIGITRCNPLVFRNVIYGSNSGIRCNGNPRIANNTVIDNNYFGIYCDWQAKPILINNIIYGNGSLINYHADDTVVFANCLLQGNTLPNGLTDAGGNIFNEDPLFFDPYNEDFSLSAGSPCINTGIAYFEWEGEVMLDLGPGQYIGIAPDMGAIESTVVGVKDDFSKWQGQTQLLLYPNPSSGFVNVELKNFEDVMMLSILNPAGKVILKRQITKKQTEKINISDFPNGMYFIKFEGDDYSNMGKIIKY